MSYVKTNKKLLSDYIREYYNERRKAKARLSNFTKEEAFRTIRKNYKQSPKY